MSKTIMKHFDADSIEVGYSLMSEEHRPNDLVRFAGLAEASGFSFATISDHFHPWIPAEGNSPFVWAVIGGVSQTTKTLRLGTAVTCPTMRMHPAIVAQAAATAGALMEGRFFLGVGTGENLNEHILGGFWPPHDIRSAMLEEALDVIRELWKGKNSNYYGDFYSIENARLFTLPKESVPIYVAVEGPKMAKLAGKIGDGLISTTPNADFVKAFKAESGDEALPCCCQVAVCYDADEGRARQIAHRQWPITGLPGDLTRELATPKLFEDAAGLVTEKMATDDIACGADVEKHVASIQECLDSGFRKVSIHNIGPNQEAFFNFYKEKVIPQILRK